MRRVFVLSTFLGSQNPLEYRTPYAYLLKADRYTVPFKTSRQKVVLLNALRGKSKRLFNYAEEAFIQHPPVCGLTEFQLKEALKLGQDFFETSLKKNFKIRTTYSLEQEDRPKFIPKESFDDWQVLYQY